VKCVECGAESADVAQTCAGCGAPVAGPRSAPAQAALEPATPVPAAVRWLLLACLLLFLILFTIGQVGAVNTTQGSRLQGLMIGISWLAVFGALAFLILFVSITGRPSLIWSLLMVIAPVHALLAFSPAAKVPPWPYAWPAWAVAVGQHRQPVTDTVRSEGWPQDTDPRRSSPIPTGSG
jgi:hypothetical protein